MASKKRRNDVGLTKDNYEEVLERSFSDMPEGQQRLSSSEKQNRRIIRASRTPINSKAPTPNSKAPTTNPFAYINLSTSNNNKGALSFSFLSASSSNGTKLTPAPAAPLAITTNTNKPTAGSSLSSTENLHQAALIAQDKEFIKGMTEGDLGSDNQSNITWQYSYYRSELDYKYEKLEDENLAARATKKQKVVAEPPAVHAPPPPAAPPAAPPTTSNPVSLFSVKPSAPAPSSSQQKPSFNFGAPTAAIASAAPAAPAAGFSFGAPTNSSAPSPAPASGFGFKSAAPAITPPGDFETTIAASASNDTPTAGNTTAPDKEEQDGVRKTEDKDWDNVDEFGTINVYHKADPKDKDSQLANFASGQVVLQTKKDDPKVHRMVMRGSHGLKVVVNMSITSDMKFIYKKQQNKKNRTFGLISFTGINDQDRGLEIFKMKGTEEVAESLYKKLEELAKKSK